MYFLHLISFFTWSTIFLSKNDNIFLQKKNVMYGYISLL